VQQASSSRLGFRGNEDLGGGLSAQFQIEHRFDPDTGAQSVPGVFWAGRSYVQLTSAGMGSVYLGREYVPAYWVAVKSDPFGQDGVGQVGSVYGFAGFSSTTNSGSNTRTSNTVGFKSADFSGLTVQAATGLSETTQTGRNDGFNVEYKGGPFYAGLGYAKIKGGTIADSNRLVNASLQYDLGVANLIGFYAQSKTNFGRDTNKTWSLATTAPIAGGKLKAAYTIFDPAGGNNKQKKFGLGYDYPLSKRTNLYADLGVAKEDQRTRNTAYAFGVKHVF
jgi:predicted porin